MLCSETAAKWVTLCLFEGDFERFAFLNFFKKYDAEELELLICGSKEFDFEALELTTKYEDKLHRNRSSAKNEKGIKLEISKKQKCHFITVIPFERGHQTVCS